MARGLSWSDVRGGLIATFVLVAVSFAILRFLRVGALHGDTIRVYALVGEARGVTPGSEVWLSGQKIGKIAAIAFRPPAADTSTRILIEMEILAQYVPAVHRDAVAQIRAGGNVIGAAVMYLTPGTARTTAIRHGDTLRTHAQADVEGASAQIGMASKEVPVIIGNLRVLMAQLQTTQGTIGAFMNGPGFGELSRVRIRAGHVTQRLTGGGTAGLVMKGGLSTRAARVMARVDSVHALLASPNSSLGRFRRDSTILRDVADIQKELSAVRAALDEPRGTAGRVLADSALTRGVANAQREMTLLFADIKKNPMRYISF
jgi:phospholipid/cholesterol/gamma-HCH transport system substrate-binding protein